MPKHTSYIQSVRGRAVKADWGCERPEGRAKVVSTSTQHAEKENKKRQGTSPELINPQTTENKQFQLASTDIPGIQRSMQGDELLKED